MFASKHMIVMELRAVRVRLRADDQCSSDLLDHVHEHPMIRRTLLC